LRRRKGETRTQAERGAVVVDAECKDRHG
jgi:hypothetical protein